MQVPIKVKRLREDAIELKYAHPGDSGMDVFAIALKRLNENKKPYEDNKDFAKGVSSWVIMPGETVLACTGWASSIPLGTELQARPTSGNGLKTKIRIPNAPGTIDSKYRGEIGIELENIGTEPFVLKKYSKIAQLVLCPVLEAQPLEVDELDETTRGANGYGSTGSMVQEKKSFSYNANGITEIRKATINPTDTPKAHTCSGNCNGLCDGGCH